MNPPTDPVPACTLDTRLPGSGTPVRLTGVGPATRWTAPDAAGLLAALPEAIAALRGLPGGLVAGVLPYPTPAGATPPTLMLFREHRQEHPVQAGARGGGFRLTAPFRADWGADGYRAGVSRVREYLAAGDAYQVNLAQRYSAPFTGNPWHAFLALRDQFAPPYAAWLDLGDTQVLSLSPESFLELEGDRVATRPIKGTRPRGADAAEDARLAEELQRHPKDRAENLMIVDLMRNDLGRVCLPGSVAVPDLFALESFRNVHHLVSTVTGRLRQDCGVPGLLAACFPGGSITGAPKRRAMEIIAELEPHPRDTYCGTVFWMTADGRFGSNIAIRTFVARDGVLHGWAGAGIVSDSDPDAEQRECLAKMQPLMAALESMGR